MVPLSSEPAVLIVGAGPTGLMVACQLAQRRIPFRIIDRKAGPTDRSKALVVQARTLEIFEQMGISAEALGLGQAATALNFVVNGRWVQHINLEGVGQGQSPFPYLYILEQSQTERLLLRYLASYHLQVAWNTELIHVEQGAHEVQALIRHKDVAEETIVASWLVGADGAHSKVREILEIPFIGGTYGHTFVVADTQVDWDFNHQEAFLCLTNKNLAAFFPMAGENCFRVVSLLPPGLDGQAPIAFADIASHLEEKLGIPLRFRDTRWFSTYRLHHRYARQFQSGRCFLAGDAAHIHSPAGGQGMNTGIQDAYNLAWKLALVIQEAAGVELLATYQDERLPVARYLVQTTDRAFGFMVTSNPILQYARLNLLPLVLKKLFRYNRLKHQVFKRISQIGIRYRKSSLAVTAANGNHFPKEAPRPGDRVPFVPVFSEDHDRMVSIYDLLRQHYFTLLVFKSTFSIDRAEQLQATLEEALLAYLPGVLQIVIVYPHENNNRTYETFGINEDAFYLIRPDNYIGFRSQPASVPELMQYLDTILLTYEPEPVQPGREEDLRDLFDPAFE